MLRAKNKSGDWGPCRRASRTSCGGSRTCGPPPRHVSTHTHVSTYVRTYARTHARTYVRMYARTHVCMYDHSGGSPITKILTMPFLCIMGLLSRINLLMHYGYVTLTTISVATMPCISFTHEMPCFVSSSTFNHQGVFMSFHHHAIRQIRVRAAYH